MLFFFNFDSIFLIFLIIFRFFFMNWFFFIDSCAFNFLFIIFMLFSKSFFFILLIIMSFFCFNFSNSIFFIFSIIWFCSYSCFFTFCLKEVKKMWRKIELTTEVRRTCEQARALGFGMRWDLCYFHFCVTFVLEKVKKK